MWTMDELVQRVREALSAEYPGAPNGRVRDVPDRRAIRWYTTTGLVDRPLMNGRVALYGNRHLLQVVAVKRRQAEGRSLAEIQAELAGAGNEALAAIARVPDGLLSEAPSGAVIDVVRPHFWKPRVAATLRHGAAPAVASTAEGASAEPVTEAVPVGAVALGGGAVLVLPFRPRAGDLSDIAAAARPLLDLLSARGLLTAETDDRSPT